ncbi:MAG: tetratricopeptide repeat protein [Burkholderiales bacterium]
MTSADGAGDPDAGSSRVDELLRTALSDLDSGRLDAARDSLLSARDLAPDNARVHYLLGLYYSDTMQLGEALHAIDESLRLDGGQAKAHNNRGSVLMHLGRWAEAEQAFRRALEIDPGLAQPYVNLGQVLEHRGAIAEADDVYLLAIERGLEREMFEQYRAVLTGRDTRASPEGWVRSTFDNFASTFDARLRAMGYRVAEDLANRLFARIPASVDMLDLGCGTGACGVALASHKRRLVGVDLSEKMLQQAALHGVYDELHNAEVQQFLVNCPAACYDLVVAADVFVYIGDLDAVFADAARVLRPRGHFAFSTEERNEQDYVRRPSGRYAQSEAYIRRLADRDFELRCADATVLRSEADVGIMGRLYVLEKRDFEAGG